MNASDIKRALRLIGVRGKFTLSLLTVLIASIVLLITGYFQNENNAVPGEYQVVDVVDGDTIKVASGSNTFTVRYIGVDTPETVKPNTPVQCYGKEASNKNKELIEGKIVILESDVQDIDTFGRKLRYVYLKENNLMVNELLVQEGYAHVATFPPNVKYVSKFTEAERQARESSKGLWKQCK